MTLFGKGDDGLLRKLSASTLAEAESASGFGSCRKPDTNSCRPAAAVLAAGKGDTNSFRRNLAFGEIAP